MPREVPWDLRSNLRGFFMNNQDTRYKKDTNIKVQTPKKSQLSKFQFFFRGLLFEICFLMFFCTLYLPK